MGHLISAEDIVSTSVKNIQVTLLTDPGAINIAPIENPSFKADKPQKEEPTYKIDDLRFSAESEPTMKLCKELKDESILVSYEIKGLDFTNGITAYIKGVEQAIDFTSATRAYLTIKNPQSYQIVEARDRNLELKDSIAVLWTKPQTGCVKEQ